MHNAHEILKGINWFLEPISNFILFLFTTTTGYWLLFISFFLYLIIPAYDAVRTRALLYKASSNFGANRMSILEKLYVTGKTMAKSFMKIIGNLPILLIVFLLMFFIVGLSKGIKSIDEYVQNRKKIIELKTVFRQLDKNYKVADIAILDYNKKSKETTLEIRFYDASLGTSENKQTITLKGKDIYFDAMVMNFEYSEIADANKKTLVLPYRIYSADIASGKGVLLNTKDSIGTPLIYKRSKDDVYGISVEKYNEHLAEFVKYMNNEKAARKVGVRSFIGNAVHTRTRKGEFYSIWAEQTGGIVIKREYNVN